MAKLILAIAEFNFSLAELNLAIAEFDYIAIGKLF